MERSLPQQTIFKKFMGGRGNKKFKETRVWSNTWKKMESKGFSLDKKSKTREEQEKKILILTCLSSLFSLFHGTRTKGPKKYKIGN